MTDKARRGKGAVAQGQREGPTIAAAPPCDDGFFRQPKANSGARKVAGSAAAAAGMSQRLREGIVIGGHGGGSGGRGKRQSGRSQQHDAPPAAIGARGSSDIINRNNDGDRSSGNLGVAVPRIPNHHGGADQGQQKLGPDRDGVERTDVSSKWSAPTVAGYGGGVNGNNTEGGSALLRARHVQGSVASRGTGGSVPSGRNNGGASRLPGGGRGGRPSSSSAAKRPCRTDFAPVRVAGKKRSDERA